MVPSTVLLTNTQSLLQIRTDSRISTASEVELSMLETTTAPKHQLRSSPRTPMISANAFSPGWEGPAPALVFRLFRAQL